MTPAGRWRFAGASAAGSSHAARGESSEDAFAWAELATPAGPVLALVVADGAGSAEHAARGARLACDGFLAWISEAATAARSLEGVGADEFGAFLGALHARLDRLAADEGVERRAFASTLVAAAVAPGASRFFQIGDGAIVARATIEARPEPVFWPEEGEYASVTNFATDDRAAERAAVASWGGEAVEVALFTDGLQRLVLDYARRTAHAPFFAKMHGALGGEPAGHADAVSAMLASYLAAPELDRLTDDDRTLVLASRVADAG